MRKIRYSGRTLFFSSFVVSTERWLVAASVPRLQAQPWLVSKPTSNWKKNISAVATENSLSHTKCYPICLVSSVYLCSFCSSLAPPFLTLAPNVLIQSWIFGFTSPDSSLPKSWHLWKLPLKGWWYAPYQLIIQCQMSPVPWTLLLVPTFWIKLFQVWMPDDIM